MKRQLMAAAAVGALIFSPAALAVEDDTINETAQEELQLAPEENEAVTEEFPDWAEAGEGDERPEGPAPGVAGDQPYVEPGSERVEGIHKLDATEGMTDEVPEMGGPSATLTPDKEAAADLDDENAEAE
jgi:hypothetical protein